MHMSMNENVSPDPDAQDRAHDGLFSSLGEDEQTVDIDADDVDASVSSRPRRHRRIARALITDAVTSPEQNRQSREKQYAILQGLRLPFILAAIWAAWMSWWVFAAVLFVVSVPLPWIAVVLGNAQGEKRDSRSKNVYKPAVVREEIRLENSRHAALGGSSSSTDHAPDIIDHEEGGDAATGDDNE